MATQSDVAAQVTQPAAAPPSRSAQRYIALDAYRGLIMILLVSNAFGFGLLQKDPMFLKLAAYFGNAPWQLDHAAWAGCTVWDLIQPAFIFMVGVAMPFALARRMEMGATFRDNFKHAASRAFKLLLLSQILTSVGSHKVYLQLINVLAQIAFTYFFCFLIMQLKFRWQVVTAALILAGHSGLFLLFPGPDGPYSMDLNIGRVIDKSVLGFNYRWNYVTINFVSSIVTNLFGVWAGLLLQSRRTQAQKIKILAAASLGAFALGIALMPFVPMIKRLWTASFTLFSAGWVILVLLALVWIIDVKGYRKWCFPLVVVGTNCIFVYSFADLGLKQWLSAALAVFTGNFKFIGTFAPVAQSCLTLLATWYLCYWLYQRKLFFKL